MLGISEKTALALAISMVCATIGIVVALTHFGAIQISYRAVPPLQPPTLTPNPIQVSLGDVVSGSSGSKDFGKVGTLSLPVSYGITFELDTSTIKNHFDSFTVYLYVYKGGSQVGLCDLSLWSPSDSITLDAGDHDIYLKVSYKAKTVSSAVSGVATIALKYSG